MSKGIQLIEKDIKRYQKEIDEIDLSNKEEILNKSIIKINILLQNPGIDQFQLVLVQEINMLYNLLKNNQNLETSVQQKILFALTYFLQGDDDIPDEIPNVGFLDDIAVVEWIIQEIKTQYSQYFQA